MAKKGETKKWLLTTPLGEVKDYLRENYEEKGGCECPACGRHVELRPRKLNSSMAYAAIIMYNLRKKNGDPNRYFKMNEEIAKLKIPSSNVEYSKLNYWGLAEQNPTNDNPKTKTSGLWRLTDKGIRFVMGEISVPRHVFVYKNIVRKISDERTNISDSLGDKFDYNELIK